METGRFLRDIEDETKYAQRLELAYIDALNAVTDVINRMHSDSTAVEGLELAYRVWPQKDTTRIKELSHVVFVMSQVVLDCGDRRKRLADVAAGLADVVFDEESS